MSEISGRRKRRIRIDVGGTIGLTLMVVMLIVVVFGPQLMPHDPLAPNFRVRLQPPVWFGGTSEHILGTDSLGRDILSRIIIGARVSLGIGFAAATVAMLIGLPIGLMAGFFGGRLDSLMMRLADVQLAFPAILLAMGLISILGPSMVNLVLVLALSHWVQFGRVVRGEVMSMMQRDFVASATALGAGSVRVMARHLLPNLVSSITVLFTVSLSRLIIQESSLSFLGFGVQPPTPAWGAMLGAGREYLAAAWWVSTVPGLAVLVAVLATNLTGDWLRDRFDPRLRT